MTSLRERLPPLAVNFLSLQSLPKRRQDDEEIVGLSPVPIVADIWGLGWVSPQHAPSTADLPRCLMPRYLLRKEDDSFPFRHERVLMGLPRSTAGSTSPH